MIFELFERPRPVGPQEARQRTIGEKASAGLTGHAVVALVVGVRDALDGIAADWARFSGLAVNRHLFVKCGHAFGKRITRLRAQPPGPHRECLARVTMQPFDVVVAHLRCHRVGGHSRRVKNFVRIRVADAGKEPGIGQRPLDRVILFPHSRRKLREVRPKRLEAAWIVTHQRLASALQIERGALLRRNLREKQRAVVEVQGEMIRLANERTALWFPVKAPGDHEMNHHERRSSRCVDAYHDALRDALD